DRKEPISAASADVILFQVFSDKFNIDSAPAVIKIRCWIVADRVKMSQIVAARRKGFFFVSPIFRKVGFATRRRAHAFKNCSRDRLEPSFSRTDHVDGNADRLS